MTILHFPNFNILPVNQASDAESDCVPEPYLQYSEDIAVVERAILPSYKGRVRYQGVSWLAQCERNIAFSPQDRVLVVDRRLITLIVEPLPSGGVSSAY